MVMPALIGGFGNFLLPILVGGPDMANKNIIKRSYIRYYSCNLKNNKFKAYLAGLFEGNGHIWIQKLNQKKQQNPKFSIAFNMRNEELVKKLLKLLGSGFIRYKRQNNACVLVVSSIIGLKKVVSLLNGKLRTPKIHLLHYLIDWLNKNERANIMKLPLKDKPLSEDSWLSGFIDSKGSFSVQYTEVENVAKKKISCRLRIEQRKLDPITNNSYLKVLTDISNFFYCTLLTREQKSTGNKYFTLTASNKISLKIILNYLEQYPLFSSKILDYKEWKEIVFLTFENKHYTDKGIKNIELLINNMNRKRSYFFWNHLFLLSF